MFSHNHPSSLNFEQDSSMHVIGNFFHCAGFDITGRDILMMLTASLF